jgi:hypothetical protein
LQRRLYAAIKAEVLILTRIKAEVVILTRRFAMELGPHGITVKGDFVEEKSRQLEMASQHKSQFVASMSQRFSSAPMRPLLRARSAPGHTTFCTSR